MILISLIFNLLFNIYKSDYCGTVDFLVHQTIPKKKAVVKKKKSTSSNKKISNNSVSSKNLIPGEGEIIQIPPEEIKLNPQKVENTEYYEPPVDPDNVINEVNKTEDKSEPEIFTAPDQNAEFPGGPRAFGAFLKKNFSYPLAAQRANVEGKVYVQFVVNTDGTIQDVQVLKSIGYGCDEEAVRVIKSVPRWTPGKLSGRPVRSRFTQPITFVLTEDEDKKSTPSYSTYTPPVYQPEVNSNKWKENIIREYFDSSLKNEYEGIYEEISNKNHKYKLAFIEEDGLVKLIFLKNSGVRNSKLNESFNEGDLKADLTKTSTPNIFKANWKMADRSINDGVYVIFREFFMDVVFPDGEKNTYLKLYPVYNVNPLSPKELRSSGTGFAISSSGIIVTNQHVINRASLIKVRGINGDFSKVYNAKVLIEDVNNDLALIQIQDSNFYNLGIIPYAIISKPSDVGTSIFVLGFPLRSSMGDEIKLTDGIISSKSGYKGNITSYQISAPIQPGNSGGPLFDKNGNLVGVVNAKIMGAENVSYAIKSSYLTNLIDQLPTRLKLQNISSVSGKSLSDQVKLIKKFIYIIEVN